MKKRINSRRRDYRNLHRRLIRVLKENQLEKTIPYFPAKDLSSQDIANMLGVNEKTVRRHKKNISHRQWQSIRAVSYLDRFGDIY